MRANLIIAALFPAIACAKKNGIKIPMIK